MFPQASASGLDRVRSLDGRGGLYLAGRAGAEDMKKLIAYSSVAHMGFVTIGLFTFNRQGIEGATGCDAGARSGFRRTLPVRGRDL
jgi:NADH-quinone oxidoreductase subunit M